MVLSRLRSMTVNVGALYDAASKPHRNLQADLVLPTLLTFFRFRKSALKLLNSNVCYESYCHH